MAGISDNHGKMCFALAVWNGEDPILKERMFGTTGHQGESAASFQADVIRPLTMQLVNDRKATTEKT